MEDRDLETMLETPVGTILPVLADYDNVPYGWVPLDGREIPEGTREVIKRRFSDPAVLRWWSSNGGSETHFPKISADEVWRSTLGIEPPEGSAILKLMIKVEN